MQYKLLNANRKCPLLSGWAELVYAPAASAKHYLGILLSVCKRIIRNKEHGDFGNLLPIGVDRKRLRCFQTLKCAFSGSNFQHYVDSEFGGGVIRDCISSDSNFHVDDDIA